MHNRLRLAVLSGLIGFLFLLPGWASAQPGQSHGSMEGAHGGKMQQKKMCGMMGGGMGRGMMQTGNVMLRHGFHRWTNLLMANAETLTLSREQLEKFDQMITAHMTKAIRDQADVHALTIVLKKDLRAEAIDLKSVEKQLQTINGKVLQMDLDGIRLYTRVQAVLTPEQKEKMTRTIGTPFPAPWEKGRGGCPMQQQSADKDEESAPSGEAKHH